MTWNYSNTSVETTLSTTINSIATSITVGDVTGFPVVYPYTLILDFGQTNSEVVNVTAGASTVLTVVRGQDSTTAGSHLSGAVVVHGVAARDLAEPQAHIAASTNVHGIGGSAAVVGTTTSQTLTNKTISGGTNTLTNVAGSSLVGTIDPALISGTFASVAVGPATGTVGLTVDNPSGTRTADLVHMRDLTSGKGVIIGEDTVVCLDDTDLVVDTARTNPGPTTVGRVYSKNASSKPAFVADRASGNTDNLQEWRANGTAVASLDKDAKLTSRGHKINQIAADTTTKLLDLQNSSPTSVASVDYQGNTLVGGTLGVTGVLTTTAGAVVGTTLSVGTDLTVTGAVTVGSDVVSGAWATWTPTLTNITLGNGTQVAKFRRFGKTIWWLWELTLGSTSAVGTTPSITLPVAAHSDFTTYPPWYGMYTDASTTARAPAVLNLSSTTTVVLQYFSALNTVGNLSSTVPWTWTTSDVLSASGTYYAA